MCRDMFFVMGREKNHKSIHNTYAGTYKRKTINAFYMTKSVAKKKQTKKVEPVVK